MNVTVVGTGSIGMTLARQWQKAGLVVTLASRTPERLTEAALPVLPIEDALDNAEAVVLAIPGTSVPTFLNEHRAALGAVVVVDATNTMGSATMHNVGSADGLLYYRAFNTLGVENFREPTFDGVAADLFFSGPRGNRETVETLISSIGLRPVWVGEGSEAADLLDALTRLWFTLAVQQGRGRHLAFRMLP